METLILIQFKEIFQFSREDKEKSILDKSMHLSSISTFRINFQKCIYKALKRIALFFNKHTNLNKQ